MQSRDLDRPATATAGHTLPIGSTTVQNQKIKSLTPPAPLTAPSGLLSAKEALVAIWPDIKSRPSIRWFRGLQAKRAIPVIKVGHLTFFEADRVRAALRKFEVACH